MDLDSFIAENDALPQNERLSNVAIAERFATSEASVRRHRRKLRRKEQQESDDYFTDIPNEVITSRGKSVRLPDGSWEKVSWDPAKRAVLDSLKYDDLIEALEGYDAQVCDSDGAVGAELFCNADDQIGKAVESGGGSADTLRRVRESARMFAGRCRATCPNSIVVTDLGDILENMWNVHEHQMSTNDLDLMEQVRAARRMQLEILKLVAPLAPNVYYVSVPSNHGQVRVGPKATVGGVSNDFGVEISYQLEDICAEAESPALRNVEFIRPEPYHETAVLDVEGTRIAFNHGHRTSGGMNGHDKWWAQQDHGRMPGWDADMLVVAHYHSFRVEQSGDGRWIICVSSSEPSSDYFALSTGKRSTRGVTCFSVKDGVWSDMEIL